MVKAEPKWLKEDKDFCREEADFFLKHMRKTAQENNLNDEFFIGEVVKNIYERLKKTGEEYFLREVLGDIFDKKEYSKRV